MISLSICSCNYLGAFWGGGKHYVAIHAMVKAYDYLQAFAGKGLWVQGGQRGCNLCICLWILNKVIRPNRHRDRTLLRRDSKTLFLFVGSLSDFEKELEEFP